MKRKILSVLTVAALTFGGAVVASAPAQALNCSRQLHAAINTPGYAMVTNYTCPATKAVMVYQVPTTGEKVTVRSAAAKAGETKATKKVSASWVINRYLE